MSKIKVYTEIAGSNGQEYGYGQYVNAHVVDGSLAGPQEMGIFASECLSRNATPAQVSASRRRVRQNARSAYQREMDNV